MAAILDAKGSEGVYNYDETPMEADYNALRADWLQIGNDLRKSMQEYASRKTA